jgi:hypothetical protein
MTQATLYIGLNDKDEKRQTMETVEAYKIVQSELVRHVGGGTIYAAEGIYTHDDGTIVVEKTLRVEIFGAPESALMALVERLKIRLNQESIIIRRESVETVFA